MRELCYELTEKRPIIEGQVIGALWKSPDLYDDYRDLDIDCFITDDGRFYFSLGNEMYKKGYNVFDDVSVLAFVSLDEELKNKYISKGGYQNIYEVMKVIKIENANTYVDTLHKWNMLNGFYLDGFNLFNEIEINNKLVIPFELFQKMNSIQVAEWYEWRVQSIVMERSMGDTKIEDLDLDDNFVERCNSGEEMGLPYDTLGYDIDGKKVWGSPILSSATLGIHKGDAELI